MANPKIVHCRDKDFMTVYATGALGGFDSQGAFHMIFYMPSVKPETLQGKKENEVVEVTHLVKVVMTPATLKQLSDWMGKNVQSFEKQFGEVETPKEGTVMIGARPPETMYG